MEINEKIKTREQIIDIIKRLKKDNKKIGFTSGAFDLMHIGHAFYLEQAKKICDVLIVGVNTDRSIKEYKSPKRPIREQDDRVKLVAALQSVDYAFLFDEKNNNSNIELLRPDYYIKAGDYTPDKLTSKPIVEKHGGEAKIIPMVEGRSTTDIINCVLDRFAEELPKTIKHEKEKAPAVFIDRDGTINKEIEYLHKPDEFEMLPGVIEGLKKFQKQGYRIIIITNQPGIGFGYYTKEDFFTVNKKMLSEFSKNKILISGIYYCPHTKSDNCSCRKPNTKLVEKARDEHHIDMNKSVFIGDRDLDIETGKNAKLATIAVLTGASKEEELKKEKPSYIAKDIKDAADWFFKKQ